MGIIQDGNNKIIKIIYSIFLYIKYKIYINNKNRYIFFYKYINIYLLINYILLNIFI